MRRHLAFVFLFILAATIIGSVIVISHIQKLARITEVSIQIEYPGHWFGNYGDNSGMRSWEGIGTQTVVLNRLDTTGNWTIYATVGRFDLLKETLRVSIIKMDGTVVSDSTIAADAYGNAFVVYTFP